MTTATASPFHIPLVDLQAQYSSIREEVLDAVHGVLNSAVFVNGTQLERFEKEFASYLGTAGAVGVSSGTAALELALRCCGIGHGDEVIVPANTFFATAEAVSNVGAMPVFADVDPETSHLDLRAAQACLTARTRAIIPVHLFGRAMDLESFAAFTKAHNLELIEDAAQAHGCAIKGLRVGGSGRLCCFSFYPGKNLGAYGDAGAVTSGDLERIRRLKLLRDHGSPTKYKHVIVGTNARLDEIQAAVLRVKLRYLDLWNARRVHNARTYAHLLRNSPVSLPTFPADGEHNFHLFVIRTPYRDAVIKGLNERGIASAIHYPTPLHLTEAYRLQTATAPSSLPVAESLAREILSLPMFAELSGRNIAFVASAVREITCGEKARSR